MHCSSVAPTSSAASGLSSGSVWCLLVDVCPCQHLKLWLRQTPSTSCVMPGIAPQSGTGCEPGCELVDFCDSPRVPPLPECFWGRALTAVAYGRQECSRTIPGKESCHSTLRTPSICVWPQVLRCPVQLASIFATGSCNTSWTTLVRRRRMIRRYGLTGQALIALRVKPQSSSKYLAERGNSCMKGPFRQSGRQTRNSASEVQRKQRTSETL